MTTDELKKKISRKLAIKMSEKILRKAEWERYGYRPRYDDVFWKGTEELNKR